jgi:putative acetyltransferase
VISMAIIRPERPEDSSQIRHVNELAFGQPAEADLVDNLRRACAEALSLVAEEDDGAIAGHILFTPVVVEGGLPLGMGLAPMAVRPDRQRQGIGSELVRRGLEILRERGCPFVVVVGHPEYYPRFGFEPASKHGLVSQWKGMRDAAFMVLVLDAHALAGVSGVARYRDEFDEVT